MATKERNEEINVLPITQGEAEFCIIGESPLIFNRMQSKAIRSFLVPGRKAKSDADYAARGLKHNPPEEYRGSVYRTRDNNSPTRLVFPCPAIKGAVTNAALDIPGARKTEIGRLVWVQGYSLPIWGIPMLKMDVVRSADMQHTPDVRTRACLKHWCARVTVSFVQPKLNAKIVATLLAAGGVLCGIGDYRQEKGKGSFGRFRLCGPDDPEFLAIQKSGGRAIQDQALADPFPFDEDTEEWLQLFHTHAPDAPKLVAETEMPAEAKQTRPRGRPRKTNGHASPEGFAA